MLQVCAAIRFVPEGSSPGQLRLEAGPTTMFSPDHYSALALSFQETILLLQSYFTGRLEALLRHLSRVCLSLIQMRIQ
jgi:hypothetical protein